MIKINMEDLIGEHTLSGVDRETEAFPDKYYTERFKDCSVVRFCLSGSTYMAVEDPDDGYRSAMEALYISPVPIKNVFSGCPVLVRIKDDQDEILQFIDRRNGKLVLEVGTDHSDSYYPYFVDRYYPENMSING